MSKVFTAQELRQRANEEEHLWNDRLTAAMLRQAADESESVGKIKSMLHEIEMIVSECNECDTYNRTEFCAEAINRISSVINASADAMEREKMYECKGMVKKKGVVIWCSATYDNVTDARGDAEQYGPKGKVVVFRREVGEWEEVKDND